MMKQEVIIGDETVSSLQKLLAGISPANIFLVTGSQSYITSGAHDLLKPVLSEYSCIRFSDFEQNPKVEDVELGIELFRKEKCDLIIAIGGGSVIDMAKMINAFHSTTGELSSSIISNITKEDFVPFIALPTTSGSGSEATQFAVVYVDEKKYSVSNSSMIPSTVYLIAEFTFRTSSFLTAVTGLDAFSQAIESWWSIHSTKESIDYSKKSLKLVWDNLRIAVSENDLSAKMKMMEASHLAGKAINITRTTGPHALSYGFTTYCGLTHGHAVSLFLPKFVLLHQTVNEKNCMDNRGADWVKAIMADISNTLDVRFEHLASEILGFIKQCGISIDFEELNISRTLFSKAIGSFSKERLRNNPVALDDVFLSGLYN